MTNAQTPSTDSPLHPNLVNLHQLLNLHLSQFSPLIANAVNVSIGQAKLLCTHAIDASLVFYLKQTNLISPSNANLSKTHKWLHGTVLDTNTLKRIEIKDCSELFGNKSDDIINRLAVLAKVPASVAKQVLNVVFTLCQHHTILLMTDGKLTPDEKDGWLALQSLLLQKYGPAQFWSAIAGHTLELPNLSEPIFKAAKNDTLFLATEPALPNPVWLTNFATLIKQKYQKPLIIGRISGLSDGIFDQVVANTTPIIAPAQHKVAPRQETKAPSNLFAWLVSGAVMATAVGVFAIPKLFNDTPKTAITAEQKPEKPATKAQALGHQDIAVVRIQEEEKPSVTFTSKVKPKEQDKEPDDAPKQTNNEQAERLAKEKADKERLAKERAERAERAKARAEKERAEQEKAERLARQKAEHKEKADKERAERLAKQRLEKERGEKAKAEQAKREVAKKDPAKPELAKKEPTKVIKKESPKVVADARPKTEPKVEPKKAEPKVIAKTEPKKAEPKPKPRPAEPNPALTTMQVNPTPKIESPKPTKTEGLTTLSIQQTTSPTPAANDIRPANSERKNKNKNNGEPIINQDTAGKLGGESESGN